MKITATCIINSISCLCYASSVPFGSSPIQIPIVMKQAIFINFH